MNAPAQIVPPYKHTPLFPLGKDKTPVPQAHQRRACRVEKIMGRDMLVVEREAIRALAEAAFTDINHLLRPGPSEAAARHPRRQGGERERQVRRLRLPQERQHRGRRRAADVPGHRHRDHHGQEGRLGVHRRRRRGGARRGRARRLPQAQSALLAARADLDVRGEEHRVEHAGAGRDLRRQRPRRRIQVPVHGEGRRLRQQVVPLSGDAVDPHPRPHDRVPEGEDPHARHRGVPAVSPRDRHRRHLGRDDHEDGEARLGALLRRPADQGLGGRPRLPRSRDGAGGPQADAVARRRRAVRRQIFLPRRARDPAAAPRRVAADRARRVVLGRPAGARQDHQGRRLSRAARRAIRRSICPTSTRRSSAATW